MRAQVSQGDLSLRAISGTRVVLLAINIAPTARQGLLGFAIGRVTGGGVQWLQGSKAFESVVPDPDPHQHFPSNRHPVQSLIWADYNAEPGTETTYRVQPMYGTPAAPTLGTGAELTVRTEDPREGEHGVYFNRGAVASQAFSEQFANHAPADPDDPDDPTVRWLARGMLQAALEFIGQAKAGDALRVGAYEFTYRPILLALKDAAARGVDVAVVYEAGTARDEKTGEIVETEATVQAAAAIEKFGLLDLPGLTLIKRTKRRNIPHNKFIVWVKRGEPNQVLAGSANFTASGFTGQTNVVHIVRNPEVAAAYLAYWEQLEQDPSTEELCPWCEERTLQTELDNLTASSGVTTFFSPRRDDVMLKWYASQIRAASATVMFTAAFGVNKTLAAEFGQKRPFVRFILLEDEPDAALRQTLAGDQNVVAAYGSLLNADPHGNHPLPASDLDRWFLKEELFRKEGHVFFLHTKFLLIDPLGDDPLVCTGSANFSSASLKNNDENMLLIRGNTTVADIYLTEFDRIFRHFFARQTINRLAETGQPLTEAKFLVESPEWLEGYLKPHGLRANRQRLFFPDWPN